jgi:hypothetical protein
VDPAAAGLAADAPMPGLEQAAVSARHTATATTVMAQMAQMAGRTGSAVDDLMARLSTWPASRALRLGAGPARFVAASAPGGYLNSGRRSR